MLPQAVSSSSTELRSNYMNALAHSSDMDQNSVSDSAADTDSIMSSPESSSASVGFIEMSDLLLPASALECELFGVPQDSGATVVSTASFDEVSTDAAPASPTASPRPTKSLRSKSSGERRHSLPSTLMLSGGPNGDAVTQPVPEFLCHLHAMLRDPSYADMISWVVPSGDEPDHLGGGVGGVGKIVVHRPEALQDGVLGNYYRHSKYASFQRQLNYFGFKKRLHGGKKGKLSPCSYIHERLTEDVGSLFTLKRRPPSKKRTVCPDHDETEASVVSNDDSTTQKPKKRRVTVEKKSRKVGGAKRNKNGKPKVGGKQQIAITVTSMPFQVAAEEYGPPLTQSSPATESKQLPPQSSVEVPVTRTMPMQQASPSPAISQPTTAASEQSTTLPPSAQPTLLELLSTSLPPPDVLFDDSLGVESTDNEGIPAWVTDDGKYHYHNVDSSLVDLAMLY